jgi:hypothetical protein
MTDFDNDDELLRERPWIHWETTYEIEAWIDGYNRDLRRLVKDPKASGYGICFMLEAGGEVYMHTTPEGIVLLDVLPDAQWIAPILTAVTQMEEANSQIWTIPGDKLTQLILGLSSLVKSTRMVLRHDYKSKRY